jgi:3-deoxy-D-manno-octulosonate 8-phosphate phosphatase (KDO 8-P phosphatase)
VLDVDGVLTDGSIMIDDHGVETKRFNVKDGLGIATWIKLGFEVAVITKRKSRVTTGEGALAHRCRELGIRHLIQGSADKAAALAEVSKTTGVPLEEMAYIGDDWPDLPALRRVGLPIAVADAAEEVRAAAKLIASRDGGQGAVREVIEQILIAKGMHAEVIAGFGG